MKLVAAFLAGLIVACFAALIYVKTTHPAGTPAQAEVAAITPSTPPEQAKAEPPPEPPAPVVDDTEPDHRVASRRPVAKPVHRAEVHSRPKPVEPPVQTAQNEPPPSPAPAPASDSPQPAVTPEPQQTAQPAVSAPPPTDPTPAPPVRQPMTVTLAAGLAVPIRLAETLSTEHNYTGDTFRATLDQPIIMSGYIIADKGSKVLGHIVEADKSGRVKGAGQLILALTEINTTDGQRVAIQTESWTKQAPPNSRARDAEDIGGGAALGAIIGAIAGGGKGAAIGAGAGGAAGTAVDLGTRGKPAVVPVETHVMFHLQSPVTITEKTELIEPPRARPPTTEEPEAGHLHRARRRVVWGRRQVSV